jgi:protease-4
VTGRRAFAIVALASVLAVLLLAGLAVLALRSGPAIPRAAVLTVTLGGELPEEAPVSLVGRLFAEERRRFADLVDLFRRAAADRRVAAVVARVEPTAIGWARLQELRGALRDFVESGKPLACHAESLDTPGFFLASACSTLDLLPSGSFVAPGVAAQVEFYKGTLGKLGIEADMEHVGAYKSASETYTRRGMSETAREQLDAILDAVYGELVEAIASDRGLEPEDLRALLDRGLLSPEEAQEAGLVDELRFHDETLEDVLGEAGGAAREVDEGLYLREVRARRRAGRDRIAVVYATGTIVSGESEESGLLGRLLGSESLAESLAEAREDPAVKAVVLRVDSPGGSGLASDAIWRETRRLQGQKPLVVSMGDLAASGGYWIALGADAIVAEPLSLTGSIGVVGGKFYLRPFYDWIGVTKEIVKRGRNADLFTDYQRFTDEQRSLVRGSMRALYRTFVARAATARRKSEAEIDRLGQGRVWTGAQAAELGLVDELGGLAEAVDRARELARIPAGRPVGLDVYPRPRGLLESLASLEGEWSGVARTGEAGREVRRLERLAAERVLALMPFRVTIR